MNGPKAMSASEWHVRFVPERTLHGVMQIIAGTIACTRT
jgi:hypothetical protein